MMPPPLAGPRLPSAALSMFSLGSGWGRGLHLTIWGGGGAWDAWKLCGGDVPSDEESLFLCGV